MFYTPENLSQNINVTKAMKNYMPEAYRDAHDKDSEQKVTESVLRELYGDGFNTTPYNIVNYFRNHVNMEREIIDTIEKVVDDEYGTLSPNQIDQLVKLIRIGFCPCIDPGVRFGCFKTAILLLEFMNTLSYDIIYDISKMISHSMVEIFGYEFVSKNLWDFSIKEIIQLQDNMSPIRFNSINYDCFLNNNTDEFIEKIKEFEDQEE